MNSTSPSPSNEWNDTCLPPNSTAGFGADTVMMRNPNPASDYSVAFTSFTVKQLWYR